MKLVILTYLEGDEKCVDRFLAELDVTSFTRMTVEGHGPAGSTGWYGAGAPYRSEMVIIFAEDETAGRVLAGVERCTGVEDPSHPIRAFLLGVEDAVACRCQRPRAD